MKKNFSYLDYISYFCTTIIKGYINHGLQGNRNKRSVYH